MDSIARIGRVRRVLNLRRTESELAKFTARLDSAAETFAVGSHFSMPSWIQVHVDADRDDDTPECIPRPHSRRGGDSRRDCIRTGGVKCTCYINAAHVHLPRLSP
jgi:hypothetical protein